MTIIKLVLRCGKPRQLLKWKVGQSSRLANLPDRFSSVMSPGSEETMAGPHYMSAEH